MERKYKIIKRIVTFCLCLVMCLGVFSSVTAAPVTGEENLLSASNFTAGNTCWNITKNGSPTKPTDSYPIMDVPTIGKTRVLCLNVPKQTKSENSWAIQNLQTLKPGSAYKMSLWINMSTEAATPFTIMVKGTGMSDYYSTDTVNNTNGEWERYETSFTVPSTLTVDSNTQIRLRMPGSTTSDVVYCVTDVTLTEIDIKEDASAVNLMPTYGQKIDESTQWINNAKNSSEADALTYSNGVITVVKRYNDGGLANLMPDISLTQGTTYRIGFDLSISGTQSSYHTSDTQGVKVVYNTGGLQQIALIATTNRQTKHFEYVFTPIANATQIRFQMPRPVDNTASITYTLSNVTLTLEPSISENLYSNGDFVTHNGGSDFEVASVLGSEFDWGNRNAAYTNLNYEIVTTTEHGNALKLTRESAAADILFHTISLTAGKTYQVSYWIKTETGAKNVYSRLDFRTSNGGSGGENHNFESTIGVKDWHQISYTYTAGTLDTKGKLGFTFDGNVGDTVYLADVKVTEVLTALAEVSINGVYLGKYSDTVPTFSAAVTEGSNYGILERWEHINRGRFLTSNSSLNETLLDCEKFTEFEHTYIYRYSIVLTPAEGYCVDENTKLILNGEEDTTAEWYYSDSSGKIVIVPTGSILVTTVKGDFNRDGKCDSRDLVRMKWYLNDPSSVEEVVIPPCDFNEDGVIDENNDFIPLRKLFLI